MTKRSKMMRMITLLAMGGATFGFATFGVSPAGCNYAGYNDVATMWTASGNAVIQTVSDNFFNLGTDYNAVVKNPTTAFAQAVWANFVDTRVPDDLPTNEVVLR